MKVYLIGMPGSGKSTLGRQLSKALNLPFVDLDTEIEKREGKPVSEIFRAHGEVYFREVESKLLQSWATSPESFIMAVGGGSPCFNEGIGHIKNSGVSIFLDVSIDTLIRRVEGENHRPLLDAVDKRQKLEQLRKERLAVYQQAHFRITEEFVFDELVSTLRARK